MHKPSNIAFILILLTLFGITNACKSTKFEYDLSSHIDDVYIPENLEDSFDQLDQLLNPEAVDTLKAKKSEDELAGYHFGLGLWMRNNWGLWRGSRLTKYFNDLGIYHPDDMSGIILDSYWRKLNNHPIRLEEQIKYYQDYWKNAKN